MSQSPCPIRARCNKNSTQNATKYTPFQMKNVSPLISKLYSRSCTSAEYPFSHINFHLRTLAALLIYSNFKKTLTIHFRIFVETGVFTVHSILIKSSKNWYSKAYNAQNQNSLCHAWNQANFKPQTHIRN